MGVTNYLLIGMILQVVGGWANPFKKYAHRNEFIKDMDGNKASQQTIITTPKGLGPLVMLQYLEKLRVDVSKSTWKATSRAWPIQKEP